MPGHGHRVFIDVARSSTPPSILRTPPRSPRNTHYRRHSLTFDERPAYVFREDLEIMQEREHGLRAINDSLLRQNHVLKTQLQANETALRDQQVYAERLELENENLRRSLENSSDVEGRRELKIRDLRKKNTRLEGENDELKSRVRELLRLAKEATDDRVRLLKDEIISLNKEVTNWRRRHEDVDRRLKRLRENMDDHIEENQRLKNENEMLKRRLEDAERPRRRHGY